MEILSCLTSKDGHTKKYLQKTSDNHILETGYYDLDEHIICISSQIGCLMGCRFCATTAPADPSKHNRNFIRNLTSNEIIRQVKNVLRAIEPTKLKQKRILFSYMGMGEPFLNYRNVVKSIKTLSKEFLKSRTTISTLGTKPNLIKKIAHEKIDTLLRIHLALHAPDDALRKKILPSAQPIRPVLEALKYFSLMRRGSSKVNYVLIKGVNDSKKQAIQLTKLLKSYPFIVKL